MPKSRITSLATPIGSCFLKCKFSYSHPFISHSPCWALRYFLLRIAIRGLGSKQTAWCQISMVHVFYCPVCYSTSPFQEVVCLELPGVVKLSSLVVREEDPYPWGLCSVLSALPCSWRKHGVEIWTAYSPEILTREKSGSDVHCRAVAYASGWKYVLQEHLTQWDLQTQRLEGGYYNRCLWRSYSMIVALLELWMPTKSEEQGCGMDSGNREALIVTGNYQACFFLPKASSIAI